MLLKYTYIKQIKSNELIKPDISIVQMDAFYDNYLRNSLQNTPLYFANSPLIL